MLMQLGVNHPVILRMIPSRMPDGDGGSILPDNAKGSTFSASFVFVAEGGLGADAPKGLYHPVILRMIPRDGGRRWSSSPPR